LENLANKQRIINLLSDNLVNAGCKTIHTQGDADVLIVETAVIYLINKATVVVRVSYSFFATMHNKTHLT
jgi:hypothetical protein